MKRYFLGLAARKRGALRQLFTRGRQRDCIKLAQFLQQKYHGEQAILTKNGRSALALALKAYFDRGDAVIVNGFTCYAVVEAVRAAGLVPIYADISEKTLNFTARTLEAAYQTGSETLKGSHKAKSGTGPTIRGIIVQNTLGIPAEMAEIEHFIKKHQLIMIEDLAHSVGVKYPDGREAGTVGAAVAFSFGKDKSIDTVSGGALVLRHPCKNAISAPRKLPKLGDYLRARLYPLNGALCRWLTGVHLGGVVMRGLIRLHLVEKSADNRLDFDQKICKFEARLALLQFQQHPVGVEREFYLVENRAELLQKLKKAGYYFDGFWYEKPISPARYYEKAHFNEENCPVATKVASKIINLPTFYSKKDLAPARALVKTYLKEPQNG